MPLSPEEALFKMVFSHMQDLNNGKDDSRKADLSRGANGKISTPFTAYLNPT